MVVVATAWEIYLSEARKVEPAKCKTVIRHPIRKVK